MSITLYELAAENRAIRFSPHCWKTRLALAHKQLDFESEAVWFTEKEKIAFSNQPLVPILIDGGTTITDSWNIAQYLQKTYPDAPPLYSDAEKAAAFNQWVDTEIGQFIRPSVIMPILGLISEEDKDYFRETREAKLGTTLEKVAEIAPEKLQQLSGALEKIRIILKDQSYIGGEQPDYRDICLLATLLWLTVITDVEFLDKADTVYAWYQRMIALYQETIPESVKQKAA